jgi:SAM-dependent methyltransferase
MPFEDNSFDFANLSELIEHVENPARVLAETFRVLAPGGRAYVSVPMRFSFRDPHYKVYGVNWVPRAFSDSYLRFFNGMKPFAEGAGRQRLADMHYYTYGGFAALARSAGFQVVDSREMKLRRSFSGYIGAAAVFVYTAFLRPLYFDTFHVILTKPE